MNFNHSQIRRRKEKKLPLKKLLLLILIFLFAQYFYFGFFASPAIESDNYATISIDEGESIKSIAKKLKKENVINSKFLFNTYLKFSDADTQIKSGVFQIPLPQNIPSTIDFLVHNAPSQTKITIPEGFKITQIDARLAANGLIEEGEFIDCMKTCQIDHELLQYIPNTDNLEGFLYPDTYFVSNTNFEPSELITKMLNNFESKMPKEWENQLGALPETDLYTAIKMASIIEREVLSDKDKRLVSGILWKRYENGWTLGADATLLYEKDNNSITAADIASDSPYNTRKFLGFPPTPISNPSTSSIEAALNPESSAYWFYLTTLDTGEVIYAITNEEHNANKVRYL